MLPFRTDAERGGRVVRPRAPAPAGPTQLTTVNSTARHRSSGAQRTTVVTPCQSGICDAQVVHGKSPKFGLKLRMQDMALADVSTWQVDDGLSARLDELQAMISAIYLGDLSFGDSYLGDSSLRRCSACAAALCGRRRRCSDGCPPPSPDSQPRLSVGALSEIVRQHLPYMAGARGGGV